MKFIPPKVVELKKEFLSGIGVPERTEFVPDPFQLEAVQSLKDGFDTLVIAPTGSGKTYIAEQGIYHAVRNGKRAIYTTPLKALSNAKYAEFKKVFEPEYSVGLLTGDRKIEADANILVATTEIYRNDMYNLDGNYGLVILDELHYLADSQRGPVWEESIILSASSSELLMLSASISNEDIIAEWITSVRNKKINIIRKVDRPVELRLGFLHPEFGVVPMEGRPGELTSVVKQYYEESRRGRNNFPGRRSRKGRRR
jgi:ATP-dependent RNA helicase HelY